MEIRQCTLCHQPDWDDLRKKLPMPGFTGSNEMTVNLDGGWVPDIPLPMYGLRKECRLCHHYWFTMRGYRGHYALEHILRLPPD
jgi:hypothetical protein